MRKLEFNFGNLMDTGVHASDLHFKTFVIDHDVRTTHYNTAGQYAAMQAATQPKIAAFIGEHDTEDFTKGVKKGTTRTVDTFIVDFKSDLELNEKTIGSVFLTSSADYLHFFPTGMTEYSNATKTTIETLLNRFKQAITAHSTSFAPAFVTKMQGYITTYLHIRNLQLDKKEDVKGFILTTDELRRKLELQISINIHTLAIEFIEEPAKGLAFFNQSLLNPSHHHPQDGTNTGPYLLQLPIGETSRAKIEMVNEITFFLLIKNNRTTPMYGYTCDHIEGLPVSATLIEWQPAEEKILSYAQLGGKPYLFFYTESTEIVGEASIYRLGAKND